MTPPAASLAVGGSGPMPALIVANGSRRQLELSEYWNRRLLFFDRVAELEDWLAEHPVTAVLTETRDADGAPVLAVIRGWVQVNTRVPVLVWTAPAARPPCATSSTSAPAAATYG